MLKSGQQFFFSVFNLPTRQTFNSSWAPVLGRSSRFHSPPLLRRCSIISKLLVSTGPHRGCGCTPGPPPHPRRGRPGGVQAECQITAVYTQWGGGGMGGGDRNTGPSASLSISRAITWKQPRSSRCRSVVHASKMHHFSFCPSNRCVLLPKCFPRINLPL